MTFIEQNPTGSWRGSPFIRGQRYRVLAEARSYAGHLTLCEVIKYFGAYYGHYDGVTVFAFTNEEGQERTWMLFDAEPIDIWSQTFFPIVDAA